MGWLRRSALGLAAAAACGAFSVSSAAALPGIGAAARRPVAGPVTSLGCGNPANTSQSGRVLPAAPAVVGGALRCFGQAVAHAPDQGPQIMPGPTGLGPTQIQSAYNLTGLDGAGRTVAVVDAYNDPRAEADLATFRSAYGLPACTVANGCLSILNQNGAPSPLPAGNYGWAEEESLDLDAVSSACPSCHIALVEATAPYTVDLGLAVNAAANIPGVVAISNSYGGSERLAETAFDTSYYNHPGIAVTASTGDGGYGVEYPAASPDVTAVGGTTLKPASNARGWTETAWSGSGSGCSAYEPKPAWQTDAGCARRAVADVSAVADPRTGLAIYDTYNPCGSYRICDILIELGLLQGLDGWAQVGGTSLSSPLIASVYALAGNTASLTGASYAYSHASSLFDVTSGSNGTCSPAYLCKAGPGYDGPSGLGTPNGTGGF